MSRQQDLEKELALWQRRLQKRKEQKATQGISADPSIDIEIEEIEAEVAKLEAQLAELKRHYETPQSKAASPPVEPDPRHSVFPAKALPQQGTTSKKNLEPETTGVSPDNTKPTVEASVSERLVSGWSLLSLLLLSLCIGATCVVLQRQITSIPYNIERSYPGGDILLAAARAIDVPTVTPPPPPTPVVLPTYTPSLGPLPPNITAADGALMVLVPVGSFTMGSDNREVDERPIHTVTLDDFYIDQYEVTNGQYRQCVEAMDCVAPRCSSYEDEAKKDHPVVCVDWEQAKNYCEWRGDRLPTEAEWEKAARGIASRTYPWGEESPHDLLLNIRSNVGDTTPVGSYPYGVSPYGAYDMAGNVWEWTQSEYQDYPYQADDGRENLDNTNPRVLRGGSEYFYRDMRASNRFKYNPDYQSNVVGFRCATDVTE